MPFHSALRGTYKSEEVRLSGIVKPFLPARCGHGRVGRRRGDDALIICGQPK